MRVTAVALLAFLALGSLPPAPARGLPVDGQVVLSSVQAATPSVSAVTWILHDATAGRTLGAKDADERRPMASTTKMMTALVAVEEGDPSDTVVVSGRAAGIGGAQLGLVAGEEVALGDLLAALLLQSSNDAAIAIAEHIAGSEPAFVALMNQRARDLGLTNTSFANPHGLDTPNHYSSARDLLTLGMTVMSRPEIADIVGKTEIELAPAPDGSARIVTNRNELIGSYPGAIGVKTGFTDDAGLVLVAAARRDGKDLYAVVMGSEDHFADAAALLDFGFERFTLWRLLDVGPLAAAAPLSVSERRFLASSELQGSALAPEFPTVVGASAGTVGQDEPPGWIDALMWPFRLVGNRT